MSEPDDKKKGKPLPRDVVLQNARRGQDRDAVKVAKAESTRVEFLLNRLHFPTGKRAALLHEATRRTGRSVLTLALFNEMVPNFPFVLGYSGLGGVKLHADRASTLPAHYRNFMNTPYAIAYTELSAATAAAAEASGRWLALLFGRKGVAHGLMIHNATPGCYWVKGHLQQYSGGSRDEPEYLTVQPLASLIEVIHNRGYGWKPAFAF